MTDDVDGQLLAIARAMSDLDHPVKRDVAAWADAHLAQDDRVAAELELRFAADDWKRCAERGIHGIMVPTELDGAGADLATVLLTLEGLGYGCRDHGLPYAICSQLLTAQDVIVRFGTPEQQQRWIPPLIGGDAIGAFAITEPEAGSDAYAMTTRADRRADGSYVLNGRKAYITLGSRCDVVVVFASTDPEAGRWGLSAFLVPTDLDGVDRLPNRDKMGMRTTPFGDLTFTDVVVPETARIGPEGAGASIFNSVLEVERSYIFIIQVGALERQLHEAVAFAREREQGGQPIGNYQAVSHRLADMKQHHEAARLFVYRAAMAAVTGTEVAMSSALAKLTGSETGVAAAMAGAAVYGAKGYLSEFEVERGVRDAIGGLVYSGTSDIQRTIVARLLGLG